MQQNGLFVPRGVPSIDGKKKEDRNDDDDEDEESEDSNPG